VAGLSVNILMLDIVWVIVVLAVEISAKVLMFKSMSVSQMTVSSKDEIVEFVSGVGQIADEILQSEGSQGEREWRVR
jgi:hypothetical protein